MGKLKEANPIKYYVAKYFFLTLGLLQWTLASVLLFTSENTPKNIAVSFLFVCCGSILVVIFSYLHTIMRRVAIGKNKIVVMKGGKKSEIEWPDVKSIDLIPIFNVYKLELKAGGKPIYFLPAKNIEPAYDLLAQDISKMGEIVSKRKKQLGI